MSCRSNTFFHEGFNNQNNQNNQQIVQTNNYNQKSKLNMKVLSYIVLFLVLGLGIGGFVYKNK